MAVPSLTPKTFLEEASSAILDFGFYLRVFRLPLRRSLVYLLYLAVTSSLVITLVYTFRPDVIGASVKDEGKELDSGIDDRNRRLSLHL